MVPYSFTVTWTFSYNFWPLLEIPRGARNTFTHILVVSQTQIILEKGLSNCKKKITDRPISDNPVFFLLHASTIPEKIYKKSIIRHLLEAAKMCIPLNCENSQPRTRGLWLQKVEEINKMEGLILSAWHQHERYTKTWTLCLSSLKRSRHFLNLIPLTEFISAHHCKIHEFWRNWLNIFHSTLTLWDSTYLLFPPPFFFFLSIPSPNISSFSLNLLSYFGLPFFYLLLLVLRLYLIVFLTLKIRRQFQRLAIFRLACYV